MPTPDEILGEVTATGNKSPDALLGVETVSQQPAYAPGFAETTGREASAGLALLKSAFQEATDPKALLNPAGTGIKTLAGLLQILFSPFVGAGAAAGETTGEYVRAKTEPLGPNISAMLGTAAGAPINLLTQLYGPAAALKPFASIPGWLASPAKTIFEAEKSNAARQAIEELTNLAKVRVTGGAGAEGPISSLANRLRAEKIPYPFSLQPTPEEIALIPEIPLTNAIKISKEALAGLEGVPKAAQPAKVSKLAEEVASGGEGQKAFDDYLKALSEPANPTESFRPGGPNPAQTARADLIQLQSDIVASGGTMRLDKVQKTLQGIGLIADRATDAGTSTFANNLYGRLMDDVRASGPIGEQFAKAQGAAYQNRAASAVADIVTKYGTQRMPGNSGQLRFDAGQIDNAINSQEWIKKALPAEQWREAKNSLEEVFRAHRGMEGMPEIVDISKMKQPSGTGTWARRVTGGLLLSAPLGVLGIPHPFIVGEGLAMVYPRLIFETATTASGRALLKTLYKTAAPTMNDVAKFQALTNFLRAQDQNMPFPLFNSY